MPAVVRKRKRRGVFERVDRARARSRARERNREWGEPQLGQIKVHALFLQHYVRSAADHTPTHWNFVARSTTQNGSGFPSQKWLLVTKLRLFGEL